MLRRSSEGRPFHPITKKHEDHEDDLVHKRFVFFVALRVFVKKGL